MSPFDFVAAVAVGAIVGRVPSARDTSYLAGALTLIAIIVGHRLIARMRYYPRVARLFDHPPRLLVADGQVLGPELRRSGLTHKDLLALLREHGVQDLSEVRYVIFEERGKISIVRHGGTDPGLVRDVVDQISSGKS